MVISTRSLFAASCVALIAAVGCGGSSPTGPSDQSGATIAGVVNGGNMTSPLSSASAGLSGAAAPSGMTVSVAGTNLSAVVDVLGHFQIAGVPPGDVQLRFTSLNVNASVQISNVGQQELVEIQVSVTGSTATVVSDVRTTGKVSLCHKEGNGSYHLIDVSVSAEPAHREHGDGEVGDPVPGDDTKVFDANCRPVTLGVRIVKSTNGQDANEAPGPTLNVGSPVTWTYVVTNTSEVQLTNVKVVDDRNVVVNCNGQTTLAAGQSMTCTGSGLATLGQYRNVGTVTADSAAGVVTHSDASHYLGVDPNQTGDEDGPKVQLCHKTGNGSYHLIEVSVNAEPAHRAHGDGKVGEAVPGNAGKVFTASCGVQ